MAPAGRAADHVLQQLERGGIRPVDVVEHERDRRAPGEGVEQPAQGAVQTPALRRSLYRRRAGPAGRPESRKHRAEQGQLVGVELTQHRPRQVADMVLERLEDGCERDVALELRRATVQDNQPATRRLLAHHAGQARLADPRLTAQHEQPPLTAGDRVQHPATASSSAARPTTAIPDTRRA